MNKKAAYIGILLLGTMVIIFRRPDIISYPQFWAEDGAVWYANAYQSGLAAILMPHAGYFQTISRLIAALAQLLPLFAAPLLFNIFAILFKITPALFLWSGRFDHVIPSRLVRVFLIAAYLLLPNSAEVAANVTNIQWYLAVLAVLILVAQPAASRAGRIFDAIALALSGSSGPFVFMLLPVALFRWFKNKESGFKHVLWPLLITFAIQAASLISSISRTRFHNPLGATVPLFVEIVTGQVFAGGLIGENGYAALIRHGLMIPIFIYPVFVIGVALIVFAFWKAEERFRSFWVFGGLILAASLILPAASYTRPQWQVMVMPGLAGRYWFIPMIAWISLLLWSARRRNPRPIRIVASLALVCLAMGIVLDFRLPAWVNHGFSNQARQFSQLPSGNDLQFDLEPAGWVMKLTKK